jgi:hypothetical protein
MNVRSRGTVIPGGATPVTTGRTACPAAGSRKSAMREFWKSLGYWRPFSLGCSTLGALVKLGGAMFGDPHWPILGLGADDAP